MASWDEENARRSGFLDFPAPKWDQMVVTHMNETRHGHATVKIDEQRILVVGGRCGLLGSINCLKSTEIYDSRTKKWEKGPDLNEERTKHAATLCNGKVYVVGGEKDYLAKDSIECLDLSTKNHNWEMMPVELSCCREGCAAVAIGTNVYIMGGHDEEMPVSSVDILDTVTGTIQKGPSMTTERYGCVAGVVKNTIYVVGGRDGNRNLLDTVDYLSVGNDGNPTASTWKMCTATLSTARIFPAVAVIKDCLIVMGGGDTQYNSNSLKSAEDFDIMGGDDNHGSSSNWKSAEFLDIMGGDDDNHGSSSNWKSAEFLDIMGGDDDNHCHGLKSAEVFDTRRIVCWNLPDMHKQRRACAAVTLEESKVIVIGGYSWTPHASVEVLELCIATIENVDKCIVQVRGSFTPIGKQKKIARLDNLRQLLVKEEQQRQKKNEEERVRQDHPADQERIRDDEQNRLIKEQKEIVEERVQQEQIAQLERIHLDWEKRQIAEEEKRLQEERKKQAEKVGRGRENDVQVAKENHREEDNKQAEQNEGKAGGAQSVENRKCHDDVEDALLSGFLDIPAPKWDETVVTQMNEKRVNHAAVKIDEQRFLVVGGLPGDNYFRGVSGSNSGAHLKTTEIYDSRTKKWEKGPDLNEERYAHAAALCNGKVYVVGGKHHGAKDSIECLDLSTKNHNWEMLPAKLSCCRRECAAVAIGTNLYIMGGNDGETPVSSMDIFDTVTGTIQKGPSMTTERHACAAGVVKNTIYVVGGRDGNRNGLNMIEYLSVGNDGNPTDSTWKMCTATLSTARNFPAVAVIRDCLIIMGGDDNHQNSLKSAEVFDTRRKVCWNLPDMKKERWGCAAVTLGASKVAAIGGYSWTPQASVEVLELCIATIENVDKRIAQVRGSFTPIGKKKKIARLDNLRQLLVKEEQQRQKKNEEQWVRQEHFADQERIHRVKQNRLIKEQQQGQKKISEERIRQEQIAQLEIIHLEWEKRIVEEEQQLQEERKAQAEIAARGHENDARVANENHREEENKQAEQSERKDVVAHIVENRKGHDDVEDALLSGLLDIPAPKWMKQL